MDENSDIGDKSMRIKANGTLKVMYCVVSASSKKFFSTKFCIFLFCFLLGMAWILSAFLLFLPFASCDIGILNSGNTTKWFVEFYVQGVDGSDCGDYIDNAQIWATEIEQWIDYTGLWLNAEGKGNKYQFDCLPETNCYLGYSLPVHILFSTHSGDNTMTLRNVVDTFEPWTYFQTTCQLCQGEQECISPTPFPTESPTSTPSPIVSPTANPSLSPSANPTFHPSTTGSSTVSSSTAPSKTPSLSPTIAPSISPTRYPIQYSNFQYDVTALFRITGWTIAQLSEVENDMDYFITVVTEYIHSGFDADSTLEYQDIVLNITSINDYSLDADPSDILEDSYENGMELRYLIEFQSSLHRQYVLNQDVSSGFNRTILALAVTYELNAYFMLLDVNDDDVSDLIFSVENMSIFISEGSNRNNFDWFLSKRHLLIISSAAAGVFIICIVFVYCRRKHRPLTISNALVAMIAIGDYSDGIKIAAADKDVKGIFSNLDVDKDITTLKELSKFMGWTFTSKGGKLHWTAKEITSFLEMEIGEMLFTANNKLKYDGLIVCVSCHGVKDNIVTSDIETIEKTAIHRMLSLKYPEIREIPRIFIFDCCNGSDRRHKSIAVNVLNTEQTKLMEMTLGEPAPMAFTALDICL